MPDLHPILGSSGRATGTYPAILMRRARNAIEARAGVPDVLLIATIRPTVPVGVRQGFVPKETLASADVVIPPVAVAVTNPALPRDVPRAVPRARQHRGALRGSVPRECQELPTGNYDVNVLSGMAGGRVIDVLAECVDGVRGGRGHRGHVHARLLAPRPRSAPTRASCSTGGRVLVAGLVDPERARLPGHRVPCRGREPARPPAGRRDAARPAHDSALMLRGQGRAGGFAVVDLDGENAPDPTDSSYDGHGISRVHERRSDRADRWPEW
jgi:hypothetical protein